MSPGRMDLVVASILLGMLFGMAAMARCHSRPRPGVSVIAAALLTLAIVSHHFTAMGAAEIDSGPSPLRE